MNTDHSGTHPIHASPRFALSCVTWLGVDRSRLSTFLLASLWPHEIVLYEAVFLVNKKR